jgi:hypothetical protein
MKEKAKIIIRAIMSVVRGLKWIVGMVVFGVVLYNAESMWQSIKNEATDIRINNVNEMRDGSYDCTILIPKVNFAKGRPVVYQVGLRGTTPELLTSLNLRSHWFWWYRISVTDARGLRTICYGADNKKVVTPASNENYLMFKYTNLNLSEWLTAKNNNKNWPFDICLVREGRSVEELLSNLPNSSNFKFLILDNEKDGETKIKPNDWEWAEMRTFVINGEWCPIINVRELIAKKSDVET